ncbi:MAG: hypothetical protein COB59_11345 [Rhodospirillaceae bacterium]|nr:MAG: hypothetical protein COB59_11345 [Rhodospirillaceae bacterium]
MNDEDTPKNAYERTRLRTAEVLYAINDGDKLTHKVDVALIILITLNVLAVVLESVASIKAGHETFFQVFEVFSVIIFTIEYIARVWSAVDNPWKPDHAHPIRGRVRYMLTWFAIIDVVAIAPFYLSMFFGADLRILRALRLLRIFKLTRYSSAMTLLLQVFREEARTIGAAMFISMLLMFVAASLAFVFEHAAQPDKFSSIPAAMYWAIITMTTVGYGDIVPLTPYGKMIGAFIGIIGLGMVALPAGILASGFNNALHRRRLALEEQVQDALQDGVISEDEQQDLDKLAQHLNLNKADVQAIMEAAAHQRKTAEGGTCPHCHLPLDQITDDD